MKRKPKPIGTGAMDQPVTIIRAVESLDPYGNPTEVEQEVGKVMADVQVSRSQEVVIAARERGKVSYELYAQNQGIWRAVTARDILVWKGVRMNVVGAPDYGRDQVRKVTAEAGGET